MKIFSSKTNYIEFFVKIGKKCPTSCSNCSYANSSLDYFDIENIFKRVDYWQNLFLGKDFVYFLYWVDFLSHPKMYEILDYIKNTWRKFKIQIWLLDLEKKREVLLDLYKRYWFFEVTIANEVNDKDDIKNILTALSSFSKINNFRFNFDLIIDVAKNKVFINKLKSLFWSYRVDKVHKNLTFDDVWNINLWITDKFYLDSSKKKVKNVVYSHCIMNDLFDIEDDIIYFNDHIELDFDWNIMLHTPLCFLAYIKIAHMEDTQQVILKKFKKFKKDISCIDWNMEEKCFKCIINNYPKYNERNSKKI